MPRALAHRSLALLLAALVTLPASSWASPSVSTTLLEAGTGRVDANVARQIWQIELMRMSPDALAPFLGDGDPNVRARAARALGRLRDPAGSRALRQALADPSPTVRAQAAWALGQLPTDAPAQGDATALLTRWSQETDPAVRSALAVAMGRRGGPDSLDALVGALGGADRFAAVTGIGRLAMRGFTDARTVDALLDLAERRIDPQSRRRAAWALARTPVTRIPDRAMVRLRALVLDGGDVTVRTHALRIWAPNASPAARADVLPRVAAATPALRVAVARSLARAPFEGDDALLATLLADRDPWVRREAIAAAASVKPAEAQRLLAPAWTSTDAYERGAAIRALGALGALPVKPRELLGADLPFPVRVAAVSVLAERPRLLDLALHAAEAPLRSAAAERLLALKPADPEDARALLAAQDDAVAQAAADAIKEAPAPESLEALYARLQQKDTPEELALACVRALDAIHATGRVPRPGAREAAILTPWMASPRVSVERARLAEVLGVEPPRVAHPGLALPDLAEVLDVRGARVITDAGELRIDLFAEEAPYTVWNFVRLAERGYYDGLVFHRVVPGFVVQTGDPRGDGWGGPGYMIPDEMNDAPYVAGTVGMALSGPDTGGSQWFVTLDDQPHLDGDYTVFGRLVTGLRTAQAVREDTRIQRIVIERAP